MGGSMKKDKQKSLKTITLDKNRLKQEMKLHTGSGVNGSCTYDDVAEILGYANGKTIINKKYTFTEDEIKKLCSAWDIRIEYIIGLDEWRTDWDYKSIELKDEIHINDLKRNFFSSLDIEYSYVVLCPCPKDRFCEDFKIYNYFYDSANEIYYIRLKDAEMLENFYLKYDLRFYTYYLFKNEDDEVVNVVDEKTFKDILEILMNNAIKGLGDFLYIAPKLFINNSEFNSIKNLFIKK
jgi:hypothetical protein